SPHAGEWEWRDLRQRLEPQWRAGWKRIRPRSEQRRGETLALYRAERLSLNRRRHRHAEPGRRELHLTPSSLPVPSPYFLASLEDVASPHAARPTSSTSVIPTCPHPQPATSTQ